MSEMFVDHPDRIGEFFEGKTVLITGATGNLGKVLLEKLLRACPKINQIALLVRRKKSKEPEERMQEILQGPLFDMLREQYGTEPFQKIVTIKGNITKNNLDICNEDKTWLCEEVNVVFHCAAIVRFDLPLKTTIKLNVKGTKEVLDLAKQMMNLQVFIHVSTAYCHLEEPELFEKAYDPPADPHQILQLCEFLSEEDINLLAPRLLRKAPNGYAYSKALSEALVVEQMENLPVLIVRPSVVLPIWKEPIPGWTDTLNGPVGLLIGAGKGVIRTMYIKENSYADYVPVDVVVNALLIISFFTTINPNQRFYNFTSSQEFKVTHGEVIELGRKIIETKVPLPGVVWYPGGSMKSSKILNDICFFLFHWIPAVIVDAILVLIGYPPVLMKVQRRIAKGCEMFEFYVNNQWIFDSKQARAMRKHLNETERKKYKCDTNGFDMEEFYTNCVIAARKYLLKASDDSLPRDKRHMKIMWFVDKTCKFLLISFFFYYLMVKLM